MTIKQENPMIQIDRELAVSSIHFMETFCANVKWWEQHKKYIDDYRHLEECIEDLKNYIGDK